MKEIETQTDKINILIVDDRPENLMALEKILERPGLNILKATSGNEALALVLEHDFALMLLDVMMPEMDGFETAELMRGSSETRHIPIIFVTAVSKEQKYIFKGYEAGAVDFLSKPLDPDILQSKVNIFLELYQQKTDLKLANRELKQARMETEEANRELVEKNQLINLQKDQLLKTLSKLEHSYEDLKKSQKQLVELERKNSIMAMAVTASHELNQPLTVIKGYIGMLEKSMEPSLLSEKQKKYLKKIDHSFEKINAILKKFNEFTSISIEDYNSSKKMVVFDDTPGEEKRDVE